jgi:hypothetical protein
MKVLPFILCVAPLAICQVRLSVEDARTLLEHLPAVAEARRIGRCPALELESLTENRITFVARELCVSESSGLIGRFTVDRFTGQIREPASGEQNQRGRELKAVLDDLRRLRQRQQLTEADILCLAKHLSAVRLLDQEGGCPSLKALPGQDADAELVLSVRCREDHVMAPVQVIRIDRGTGLAKAGETGEPLDLADPNLRSTLVAARALPRLTLGEARDLVGHTDAVTSISANRRCYQLRPDPNSVGGHQYSFWLNAGCDPYWSRAEQLLVDFYTGEVRSGSSGRVLDSPTVVELRNMFVELARERQRAAEQAAKVSCYEK